MVTSYLFALCLYCCCCCCCCLLSLVSKLVIVKVWKVHVGIELGLCSVAFVLQRCPGNLEIVEPGFLTHHVLDVFRSLEHVHRIQCGRFFVVLLFLQVFHLHFAPFRFVEAFFFQVRILQSTCNLGPQIPHRRISSGKSVFLEAEANAILC